MIDANAAPLSLPILIRVVHDYLVLPSENRASRVGRSAVGGGCDGDLEYGRCLLVFVFVWFAMSYTFRGQRPQSK